MARQRWTARAFRAAKSELEGREERKEKGAGAPCIARLQREKRRTAARLQPEGSGSAGAPDFVRLPCLPHFSLRSARNHPISSPHIASCAPNRSSQIATSKSSPNRSQNRRPQTLELPPAPHQGDGPAVQKNASAGASEGPSVAVPSRPTGGASARSAASSSWIGDLDASTTTAVHGRFVCTMLVPGLQQPSLASSSAGLCWAPPAGVGGSASPWYMAQNIEDSDPQAWGLDSHPPGGFLNILKNTSSHAQAVSNESLAHPINVGDDTNGDNCVRTEKRLPWTAEEDRRLVSAWLNNTNDPIQSNYKKNDQYWKDVAAVYNSTTPKNRTRLVKQVKDWFGRIKKKVAWFCASWKEANALYASGESDVDLKKRAKETYEADHKDDGPFMFEHCWEILKKEPKWSAYLERLEDLEPEKRKFSVDDEVGKHFNLDDARDERPIGGKQAKEQRKRKRKDEDIIDLEDELSKFVDAQNAANEGRKEMLETQRRGRAGHHS